VALGQGVSLVPEMAAQSNRDKRLVYRKLAGPPVEREIGMMWRPRYRPRRLVEAVLDLLRDFGSKRTTAEREAARGAS
jgi:DNA-binding transcriptional LysR family regulator